MTKNKIDLNEIINENWEVHKYTGDGAYTKTTQFMLPAIELTVSTTVIKSLVNTFIDDAEHEHEYKYPIFLLFKYNNPKEWNIIYEQLTKNVNYIHDYNVGHKDDHDLVMVVFSVPSKFQMDYHNFKMGRYSEFSEDYKKKFPKYVSLHNKKEEAVVWQIIHKDAKLKRSQEYDLGLEPNFLDDINEIWDKPNKKTEIYNYK